MSVTYNQDTSTLQAGQNFTLDLTVPRVSTPALGEKKPTGLITNETGCLLSITLSGGRNFNLPAGAWTKPFAVNPQDTKLNALVLSVLPNSPVNTFSLTIYNPTEEVIEPVALGNSPIGISGQVSTTAGKTLQDDTDLPNTIFIEATPTDQSVSSITLRNDASGFLQVLSANVIRKILNVVRGTSGSTKAVIDIGDTTDKSITTYHGLLENINSDGGKISSDGTGVFRVNNIFVITPGNQDALQIIQRNGSASGFLEGYGDGGTNPTGWYIYDQINANYILFGAIGSAISAIGGRVPTMRSAGGGQGGIAIFEGTTDPTTNAGNGDLWVPQ